MILSERWMRKVQEYELRIQMKRLMIEVKKLEHNLNILKKEHEEEKRAAYELSLKLRKQLKRKRCYECREYGHLASDCTNRDMIFQEYERPMNHFSKDHGVEVDEEMTIDSYPTHDLFHDAQIDHVICELNDPPIFDSYEHEVEGVNSLSGFTNEVNAEFELGEGDTSCELATYPILNQEEQKAVCTSMVEIPQHEDSKPESRTVLKSGLLGVHIEESTSILAGGSSSLIGEEHSGTDHEISGENAPDLHLISLETSQFGLKLICSSGSPATHVHEKLEESFEAPMDTLSSVNSPGQSGRNNFKNCSSMLLRVYGFGLLDYYIEDDELKDVGEVVVPSTRFPDLRSNLFKRGSLMQEHLSKNQVKFSSLHHSTVQV